MIAGMGDLGAHVLDMLSRVNGVDPIVVAGRNERYLQHRVNLTRFTAAQFGCYPNVGVAQLDLHDVDRTAEVVAAYRPEVILNTASLQSWRRLTFLPTTVFEALDAAQFGPWLPMHLTLMYNLMRAVRLTGLDVRVVNAAYPDAVNPVLAQLGLAPTIGIGNVANIVPALQRSAAHLLGEPVESIEVSFVAHHYVTHYIPRFGAPGDARCHLSVSVGGIERKDLDTEELYGLLTTTFKRIGGTTGQVLTAGSACRVLLAMLRDTDAIVHAPGPHGLIGGYPVRVGSKGGEVTLPPSLTLDEAIAINADGQKRDGIDSIDGDGTVRFGKGHMAIMSELLGYDCDVMPVADSAGRAEELGAKFRAFARRHGVDP